VYLGHCQFYAGSPGELYYFQYKNRLVFDEIRLFEDLGNLYLYAWRTAVSQQVVLLK
jgi:hypothetical protein